MKDDCIFCKIIAGKVPCYKVYENESVLAFLDIHPVASGHTLVIPKSHSKDMFEIIDKDQREIFSVVRELAPCIKDAMKVQGINVLHASGKAAGQSVFHTHIHIIPRTENDGLSHFPQTDFEEKNFDLTLNKIKDKLRT